MYAAQRRWIPANNRGVRTTLEVMSEFAREPSELVRATALAILPRNPDLFPDALRAWLSAHIRQEPDPYNVELLRTPEFALSIIGERGAVGGDCDDVATLAAALALAAGFDARYIAVAWGTDYSHVYTEVLAPGPPPIWYQMDVHRPPTDGLPEPTRELVVYP